MSPETLLRQFEVMADAPNGVQKLRELILQLAVRGKLVPQDPSEEPASVLLERIAAERRLLVKAGKVRRPKSLAPINEDEVPFEVPEGWAWVRIGAVTPHPLTDGDWVESKDQDPDGDVRLVQLADVGEGEYRDRSARFLTSETATRLNCTYLEVDDVLIARLPNPLGRACLFPGDAKPCVTVVDVAIARCGKTGPLGRYLMHAINSTGVRAQMYAFGTGTTRFRISTGNISTVLLPVPPLPEQRRIVSKVDELMALCDELEARQQRRTEARARLNRSALHHLTTATDDAEFAAHWQRLQENFHLLYDTPETVAELRQAVLQLAVRGKLVPQNPVDEPASVLLERIAAEKQRLVKEGKIRKPKPPPLVGEDKVPFGVPEGWEWVRFGDVIELVSGQHLVAAEFNDHGEGLPYLTGPADFGTVSPTPTRWTSERRAIARKGDILLTVKGAGIGKTNTLDCEEAAISRQLMAIRPLMIERRFAGLLAASATEQFRAEQVGIAIPGIGRDDVLQLKIPLPPLPEQRRIVARVDELMALCDRLEARLTAAREKGTHLAASVVHHLAA